MKAESTAAKKNLGKKIQTKNPGKKIQANEILAETIAFEGREHCGKEKSRQTNPDKKSRQKNPGK